MEIYAGKVWYLPTRTSAHLSPLNLVYIKINTFTVIIFWYATLHKQLYFGSHRRLSCIFLPIKYFFYSELRLWFYILFFYRYDHSKILKLKWLVSGGEIERKSGSKSQVSIKTSRYEAKSNKRTYIGVKK